jgi:uncharacterized membrane protein
MRHPDIFHAATFRLNSILFVGFLTLAVVMGRSLPARVPVHFDALGQPTAWTDGGLGVWILLVVMGGWTFSLAHMLQVLVANPETQLVNLPNKKAFFRLPVARRIPVLRRVNRMMGLVNTATLIVFAAILFLTWWTARVPDDPSILPLVLARWTLWMAAAAVLVFPLTELWVMHRMIRRKLEEEGLADPS